MELPRSPAVNLTLIDTPILIEDNQTAEEEREDYETELAEEKKAKEEPEWPGCGSSGLVSHFGTGTLGHAAGETLPDSRPGC